MMAIFDLSSNYLPIQSPVLETDFVLNVLYRLSFPDNRSFISLQLLIFSSEPFDIEFSSFYFEQMIVSYCSWKYFSI